MIYNNKPTCSHYDGTICVNIQGVNYGHDCDCPDECNYYEGDKMDYDKATFKEVLEQDIIYIRNVIYELKNKITYDEYFGGWCIGETPLRDYIYEEENTILNPKELEGYMEEIIEDELKLKK